MTHRSGLIDPYGAHSSSMEEREQRRLARDDDYRRVFGTETGRRVLSDILGFAGIFTVDPTLTDKKQYMLEGQRALALHIFDKAGGARQKLPAAMTVDNLKEAIDDDGNDEPDDARDREPAIPDYEPAGDPLFGDDLIDGDE